VAVAASVALHTRREVWSLGSSDSTLKWYAKAVEAMRARPDTDPTSWSYQAAIHGKDGANLLATWNRCEHGTWYFVAWHRMFVHFFEEIARAAIVAAGGPESWALPYWNYGLNGRHATLPLAFRSPQSGGGANPLYEALRAPGINSGATIPPAVTSATVALSRPSFVGASEFGGGVTKVGQFWSETGRLEQTPHNDIHNIVGGANGLMGDPDTAAEDPIFWLHHTNIDRLWWLWSRDSGHTLPTTDDWTKQSFGFFSATGHPAAKTCAEVLEIADLGYTYG